MGKVLVIHPDGREETLGKRPSVKEATAICGGWELVHVLHDGRREQMVVHDDGIRFGLPVNQKATDIYHTFSNSQGRQNPNLIHGVAILLLGKDVHYD